MRDARDSEERSDEDVELERRVSLSPPLARRVFRCFYLSARSSISKREQGLHRRFAPHGLRFAPRFFISTTNTLAALALATLVAGSRVLRLEWWNSRK